MAYTYTSYKPSSNVIDYKKKQDTATNNYNNYANAGYSAGAGGLGSQINSASAKLNNLYNNNNLSQQFNYSKQQGYNTALNNVANRKAFSYDLGSDQLFQQAKEQYQAMGKTAMSDTIGQASAMTGGYGNSYAATAGSQAYQSYLQQLNNSIGDYYAMALSGYNSETDRLNGVLNAYQNDRATESSEWANNWNVYNSLYNQYYGEYSDMLGKDQNAWAQKGSNLYKAANLATSQYDTESGNDINVWNAGESLRATQAEQEETARHNAASEAETIRANKASEAYNTAYLNYLKSKEESNNGTDDNSIEGERTANTTHLIEEIDRAYLSKYPVQSMDPTANGKGATMKNRNNIVREYLNKYEKQLSDEEIAYIAEYYKLGE